MDNAKALMQVVDNPEIDRIAEPLSKAVRGAYDAAGPAGQGAKNARRVLNGPATHDQPCLVARERDGRIEVKVASESGSV